MKVITIMSSPRDAGNSNTMVEQFGIWAEKKGHEIINYNLNKIDFQGCQACRVCKETGLYCILNDDLSGYWKQLIEADVLVLGSPNYMGTISGNLKLFIDRHYCTKDKEMKTKLEKEKLIILCMSQGKADESFYQSNYNVYQKYFKTHGFNMKIVTHCGHEHVEKDEDILNKISEISSNIF